MNEERPIEKLLRRYAKKRRGEAGPARELHPATRRMLQSEVERQFPKPASKERSAFDEFIAAFARRWIYAVGVFVALMVAAVMLMPSLSKSKGKSQLVLNNSHDRPEALVALEPAARVPSPRSAAIDELVTNDVAGVAGGSLADNRSDDSARRRLGADRDFRSGGVNIMPTTDPASFGLSAAPMAESAAANSSILKREEGKVLYSEKLGATRNVNVATTADSDLSIVKNKGSVADALIHDKARLASGGGVQEKDAQYYYRQNFSNDQPVLAKKVTAVSGEAKAVAPVLANFQIEQSGNEIRVIDSDGSMYLGEVTPVLAYGLKQNASFKNDTKESESLADRLEVEQQRQVAGAYQYRVEGTNRTLNQQVVFAWNYVPITNALVFSNSTFASSELKKVDAANFPQQFPGFQNSYINGRAQIASEKEIEINARPVSP